ncbi:MAG: hypothetical protein CVU84_01720 [Firmicutes bacterium HGW-Firmicutes-1]|jgi:hypothetical protein|nr:MAG: hypothetical protein CVU84_01720 [Firmicutes bacterium HGW-Firmicutes-1]
MKKTHIFVFITLIIYSITILLLILVKKEEVNSLTQTFKDNEAAFLKNIDSANSEISVLKQDNIRLQEEKLELIHKMEELTTIDGASIEGLKKKGINDINIILKDLLLHLELIPYDGTLGGTMNFFNIYILNDKWVYARFEDGHIQGYGIYEFTIDEDQKISWKIIDTILDGKD